MNILEDSNIDRDIQDHFTNIIKFRRHIHSNPETGPEQPKTTEYIKSLFSNLEDVSIIENDPKAGLVININGLMPGPSIAFRADMDAIEIPETNEPSHIPNKLGFQSKNKNKMHACGHDIHTAILIGFGHVIHGCRENLKGQIRLLFQAGEEGHGGAEQMIKAGYLEGVQNVFALHCWPDLKVGQIGTRKGAILASIDIFSVSIKGIGGHGAMSEKASDQILAMTKIINDLQSITSRKISGLDQAVLSVCYANAGTSYAPTTIPEKAQFKGSVRAFKKSVQQTIESEIRNICKHGAYSVHSECEVEIEYVSAYPPTVNEDNITEKIQNCFSSFIKGENLITEITPALASDDFSHMTEKVPSCIFFLGCTDPEDTLLKKAPLHNYSFDADERAMMVGVQSYKNIALHLLS